MRVKQVKPRVFKAKMPAKRWGIPGGKAYSGAQRRVREEGEKINRATRNAIKY